MDDAITIITRKKTVREGVYKDLSEFCSNSFFSTSFDLVFFLEKEARFYVILMVVFTLMPLAEKSFTVGGAWYVRPNIWPPRPVSIC